MQTIYKTTLLLFFFAVQIFSQSVDELIKKSEEYYEKFDNNSALKVLEQANKLSPNNWEVLWRLSRTCVDIAEHMPSSKEDEQLSLYEKGLDYANQSIKLAPDKSVTYLRRAIVNGRIALFKGVFSVGKVVESVRDDAEKAIKLGNGGNEIQATAHYVLARTHAKLMQKSWVARKVAGLSWADYDVAINNFKKAISLRPNYVMFYVDYAIALIDGERYDEAKEQLNKALNSPIQDEDDKSRKEEAKQLLNQIKNK
jgi:tetratricopeptide (TPR) repeat protein